jgi:hypothetical protein
VTGRCRSSKSHLPGREDGSSSLPVPFRLRVCDLRDSMRGFVAEIARPTQMCTIPEQGRYRRFQGCEGSRQKVDARCGASHWYRNEYTQRIFSSLRLCAVFIAVGWMGRSTEGGEQRRDCRDAAPVQEMDRADVTSGRAGGKGNGCNPQGLNRFPKRTGEMMGKLSTGKSLSALGEMLRAVCAAGSSGTGCGHARRARAHQRQQKENTASCQNRT